VNNIIKKCTNRGTISHPAAFLSCVPFVKNLIRFLAIAVLISPSLSFAENARGIVRKVDGDVRIIRASGESVLARKAGLIINKNDTIKSLKGGSAVVKFNDGTMTVLVDDSEMKVGDPGYFSHLGGKIYYHFRKLVGEKPRAVKTSYATLGVRGTTFIVNDSGANQSVSLKTGKLSVESPGPTFEIHRKKQQDEYDKFRGEMEQGVQQMKDDYKTHLQQLSQEFIEYKKQFTLVARRTIRVKGNRVDEQGFNAETEADFNRYEAVGGDLLKDFRKQMKKH